MHILGHGVNSFTVIIEISISSYIGIYCTGLGNPLTTQGSLSALPDSVHMGILKLVSAEMQTKKSNHYFLIYQIKLAKIKSDSRKCEMLARIHSIGPSFTATGSIN